MDDTDSKNKVCDSAPTMDIRLGWGLAWYLGRDTEEHIAMITLLPSPYYILVLYLSVLQRHF